MSEAQQREITNLLAQPLVKRIDVLRDHYGMCETCALFLMVTTLLAVFKLRDGSTLTVQDALDGVISGVSKVFDMQVMVFDSKEELEAFDKFMEGGNTGKMH